MFVPWVVGYDSLTEVQKIQAVKKESESFVSSCVNLAANIKASGVLKTLQKDRAAQNQQNRRDKEDYEGHQIPDPHKALPGEINIYIHIIKRKFVYSNVDLYIQM